MKLKTFFDEEFKLFSIYDCQRSIPSIIDGLKVSQRKCIFGLIKRGENAGEIKIAQASGWISQISDYHHGEQSLNETLIGLAQNYAGSNNLNYLKPSGQFGSRLSSEASAPRYIFTEFTDSFRKIFKKEDDIILNHLESDGQQIEPDFYIPILPNILINGAKGVGTGYACNVLKYNPNDLRNNILNILKDKDPDPLIPWYRNFKGTVTTNGLQIINTGVYEVINTTKIRITELPIGVYLEDYKKHLFKLMDSGIIKDFTNDSTEESFDFTVTVPRTTTQMTHDDILTKFKLVGRDTQNLTMWVETGHIKVFSDVQEIIDYFIDFRLAKYEERRIKLLKILKNDLDILLNKQKFIQFYIDNSKMISGLNKKELEKLLSDNEFNHIDKLLDMRIYNLTKDDIAKLESQIEKLNKEILGLEKTNCIKMYIKELTELEF